MSDVAALNALQIVALVFVFLGTLGFLASFAAAAYFGENGWLGYAVVSMLFWGAGVGIIFGAG